MNKLKTYSIVISIITIILLISIIFILFMKKKEIEKIEAQNIAYEYANVKEENISNIKVKKDIFEDEYEIKFTAEEYKYEFEIDAKTGRIINFEKDLISKKKATDDKVNDSIDISEEDAKEIALNYVKANEKNVTFTKVKIDRENGKAIYELEFFDDDYEYEIDVEINTKEVVKYSKEPIKSKNTNSNDYISKDKAKELVLEHLKLSSENIKWHKVELDIDYNIKTYEIEFFHNNLEYEYEVNAIDGSILKYEVNRD